MACPQFLNVVLAQEVPIAGVIALAPTAPTLADDRPVNEYFFVCRLLESRWSWQHVACALL
ncbi:MAG TPA: hypothetical protein VGQ77_11425 [Methylomirabilota bacterium]|jgi:hypothetical protein|nr:hypothetical protein [Methylomirabilota bacterium]